MRWLRAFAILALALSCSMAQSQSDPGNLETFPTILPDSTTLPSATAFDPSRFPTGHGPALPPSSVNNTLISDLPSSTSASVPPRTTLISASHTFPSLSGSEYVITSTVDGSVATVTVTNTAEAAVGTNGSSGAGTRAAGWAAALAGAAAAGGALALC